MIERLYLDYTRAPAYSWLGKFTFGLGVLAMATAAMGYYQTHQSHAQLQTQRTQMNARPVVAPPIDARRVELLQQATRISHALMPPWETLFQSLESCANADTTLLRMETAATPRELHLVVEARDFAAMMHYLERVRALPFFTHVRLINHHQRHDDPQHPVRFEASITWGNERA